MSDPVRLDCEAASRPDRGTALSLGDALASAVGSWIAEALQEPASPDRDRRLSSLVALSDSLDQPLPCQ